MATRSPKTPAPAPALDPRVFAYSVKPALIAQVLHVYRDNTHQNTSKVKTRGELTKTTKKVYKQKGTGKARHGSRMAPIYVGGGVAHGPTGLKPANLKVNRKMKAAALAGLLSLYAKDKLVELVSLPKLETPKAQTMKSLLPKADTLLVYQAESPAVLSSIGNLANVAAIEAGRLNAYHIAANKYVALTPAAASALVTRLTPLLKVKAK